MHPLSAVTFSEVAQALSLVASLGVFAWAAGLVRALRRNRRTRTPGTTEAADAAERWDAVNRARFDDLVLARDEARTEARDARAEARHLRAHRNALCDQIRALGHDPVVAPGPGSP